MMAEENVQGNDKMIEKEEELDCNKGKQHRRGGIKTLPFILGERCHTFSSFNFILLLIKHADQPATAVY